MDMTPQTAWLIAISAVVIVGVVAFFIGRSTAGTKARIDELEAELRGKQEEVETYRKNVEAHFDKTATLFVSMAGSYKELFEHLSSGYETLSTGSARALFQQRVDALLVGGAREGGSTLLGAGAGAVAGVAATAAAAGVAEAASDAPETAADAPPADIAAAGAQAEDEPAASATVSAAAHDAAEQPGSTRAEDEASPAAESASVRVQALGEEPVVAEEPVRADPVVDDADAIVRRAEGGGFDPDATASPAPGARTDAH